MRLSRNSKLDKDHWYYNVGAAIVTTPSHEEHKEQRAAVVKFFQPQALKGTKSLTFEAVEKLCLSF
jgi:hypothetical protein